MVGIQRYDDAVQTIKAVILLAKDSTESIHQLQLMISEDFPFGRT